MNKFILSSLCILIIICILHTYNYTEGFKGNTNISFPYNNGVKCPAGHTKAFEANANVSASWALCARKCPGNIIDPNCNCGCKYVGNLAAASQAAIQQIVQAAQAATPPPPSAPPAAMAVPTPAAPTPGYGGRGYVGPDEPVQRNPLRDLKAKADKEFNDDSIFMTNATAFPNALFSVTNTYQPLATKWETYKTNRTADINSFANAYNDFVAAKKAYSDALIDSVQRNKSDEIYANDTNVQNNATKYGVKDKYDAMKNAWNNVVPRRDASDASGVLLTYNVYYPKYKDFVSSLDAAKAAADAKAASDAASAAAAAAARAKAKADAKAAWEAAQALADKAIALAEKLQSAYTDAVNAIPSYKLVYDNAQAALDATKAKKAAYDDALAQQTAANALLKTATDTLSKANATARKNMDNMFTEDSTFVKNAAAFPNETNPNAIFPHVTFGVDNEYNAMAAAWTAYNTAKTSLSGIDTTKIAEISAATDTQLAAYTTFTTKKKAYSDAVIKAMKANTKDSDYVKDIRSEASKFTDVSNMYDKLNAAWTKVTERLNASDVANIIVNYNAYIPIKTEFVIMLLSAQGKRAEAEFQARLAAGRDAAAQWAKSGTKGCRNIQTAASTNQDMLDQDIVCNDNEFISGYKKVTGFDAAPIDPNVTNDSIGQYLALRYSCCAVPIGEKGPKGKNGLPGFEGAAGPDGPQGPIGVDGSLGKRGPQGDTGPEGARGPQGEQGEDGEDGCMGPDGRVGKSVKVPYIRHLAGPAGATGKMGPRGPQGAKGKAGIITTAPVQPFTELDRTVALFDIQDKMSKYAGN